MNPALVAMGLALVAGVPLAALGWAAAAGTERLTREPRLRERAWSLALHLPLLVAAGAAAVALLPAPAAGPGTAVTVEVGYVSAFASAAPGPVGLEVDWTALAGWGLGAALLGAVVRLLLAFRGARRAGRLVAGSTPFTDVRVLEIAARGAARLGVPALGIRVSADVGAPLLAGLRCPVVLLPEPLVRNAGPQALALVCVHELAHLRRGDNRRLLIEEAVLGALWFNPFAHLVRARLRAVREEACDALALAAEPPATRRLYAETLIATLRLRAGPELQPAFTGARRRTAMRLNALLHPADPTRAPRRLAAAGLLAGLLAGAGGAALALADAAPPDRASVHSYTSVITADEPDGPANVAVTVRSDRFEEIGDGATIATGRVEVDASGALAGLIEVDGRPQAAGFDPRSLQGRIERVETRGADGEGQPVFNLVTRPAAVGGVAPQAAAPVITRPDWAERPTGEDLGAAYPVAARAAGLGGRATMQCRVETAGTLSGCTVVSESPAGAGFGQATLALAPKFRMTPATSDGRPVAGGTVRIPLVWQVAEDAPPSTATTAVSTSCVVDPRGPLVACTPKGGTPVLGIPLTTPAQADAATRIRVTATQFSSNPPSAIYIGDVRIEGDLSTMGYPVFVNDKRAAPGTDFATLGRIARVDIVHKGVIGPGGQRPPVKEIRITTER